MIDCASCGAPVYGERGFPDCDAQGCERWQPGDWYQDGSTYTCERCGAVNLATCDGETAVLRVEEVES